jgi:hypothetical protein
MFGQIAEQRMHQVRWVVTLGWLLLIASLLYDPFTSTLTAPDHPFSPLRIDPDACVKVQGVCLPEQPYAIGATIFWGAVVPSAIFILLIFGHELWRRICPLSFLSQIPRSLGWQRQFKRVNAKTGKTRYELAKVNPESWLGRNYLYLQFGLLYLGLCARILFINSHRGFLAGWLILTIVAAIAVGYLYGGKSWCNYFCPMSPVQKIYAEPGGLLASKAHLGDQQITQSMCRTVSKEGADAGKEQSACVACQNPCIDIDSERSYWNGITRPELKFLYYGYVGLVVGYFCYYYLYAGNWNYYFSGAWARQPNQLDTLLSPGFYLLGNPIAIPKLVAVPLTLAAFTAGGYWLGKFCERRYQAYIRDRKRPLSPEVIQHRIFTLCTFGVFNFFFIFGGRPLILLLPLPLQFFYEAVLVGLSTLWLYQAWQRHPDRYARESLASRLRRQLSRLQLNVQQFIEGRSLEDLSTDEVYVLAKVLPGFTHSKRQQAYKGVLQEALEEGYVDTSSSLEVLKNIREELDISEEEHRQVLEELGIEDPALLDPNRRRSLENQVRLNGYRKALERMLMLQQRQQQGQPEASSLSGSGGEVGIQDLLEDSSQALRSLRRNYSVTFQEEAEILDGLNPEARLLKRADFLLDQLRQLIQSYHALNQPLLQSQTLVLDVLRSLVKHKKQLLVLGLLEILEYLRSQVSDAQPLSAATMQVAQSLANLASTTLQDVLEESASSSTQSPSWQQRLGSELMALLNQPNATSLSCSLALSPDEISSPLEALIQDPNPMIQAASLYLLYQINPTRSREEATTLLSLSPAPHALVQEVATTIQKAPAPTDNSLREFGSLEKLIHLSNSDFFRGTHTETLIALAKRSTVTAYNTDDVITESGDTCRELLLLIEGNVQIQYHRQNGQVVTESLLPGFVLDELEVLSHAKLENTIIAQAPNTRVLAIPVDTLDDLLDRDHEFARQVLEMESRRLQQLLRD